ncbi:MAG TPA: hypothetical protein VHQ04_10595, partial [Puia sp.]|nr:hypothetical protein [Puia sp.]
LITTQLLRNQGTGMANSDSKKNIVPAKRNSSGQKIKEAVNDKAVLPDATTNNIQPAVQQNIMAGKNQSVEISVKAKTGIKPDNDLSGKNNTVQPVASASPVLQNPSSVEDQDGPMLAMQKSNAQELQPVDSRNDVNPKPLSAQPGNHSPALLIAATGTAENVPHMRDESAAFAESEDQGDNAISVVALNDKNKGITRLFKKLTRRAPTVENDRKVRVSVFQFSY